MLHSTSPGGATSPLRHAPPRPRPGAALPTTLSDPVADPAAMSARAVVPESHEPLSCRVDGREVHATLPEIGLTHRIRALFESAIRSAHGSQCPLLWRMYLSFLVGTGSCSLQSCLLFQKSGAGAPRPGRGLVQ